MNVLHICANPKPIEESTSKQLAAAFFTKLAELDTDVNVTNVDLYQNKPPYVSLDALNYFWKPVFEPGYQTDEKEARAAEYSKGQTELLKGADILVLTMPMWCNSVPGVMKSWMDQVIVPGELFEFQGNEIKPLHHIRQVILLISSGATFKEDDPADGLTPAIRSTFRFIGVNEISIAWADGQDKNFYMDSEERKQIALETVEELAEDVAEMAKAETVSA